MIFICLINNILLIMISIPIVYIIIIKDLTTGFLKKLLTTLEYSGKLAHSENYSSYTSHCYNYSVLKVKHNILLPHIIKMYLVTIII